MDRVHELQAANEILSGRRRAKKKRLKNGGAMTVGEAQASIDRMDVDKQVVEESSQRGGRGRSAGPVQRRCGVCSKPGHNARTC
jgi:hypothetical protein